MRKTVQLVVSAILIVAASLKAQELLTRPGDTLFDSFTILAIAAEALLGIWLVSGVRLRAAWRLTLVTFALFALLTGWWAIWGYSDCGCFGAISVHPWTTLTLDIFIVVALLVWRPHGNPTWPRTAVIGTGGWIMAVLGGILINSLAMKPAATTTSGTAVLVQPMTWIGQRLPLLWAIDEGMRLENGDWWLVFHRNSCQRCHAVAAHYERVSVQQRYLGGPRVAFVEVPPYTAGPPRSKSIVQARLSDKNLWAMQTPCRIRVKDGFVVQVQTESPSF